MEIERRGREGNGGPGEEVESHAEAIEGDRLLVTMVVIVLICLLLGGILIGLQDLASGLYLVAALAAISSGLALVGLTWLDRRETILTSLAIAVEHGMPLDIALEAQADQYRGRMRRRILALIQILRNGAPFPQALKLYPGILPSDTALSIATGWTSNHLAEALKEAAEARVERRRLQARIAPRIAYLATVLFIAKLLIFFILYFIIPKFEAIFYDFGLSLPSITTAVINTTYSLNRWGWPILLLMAICELTAVVLLPVWLSGQLRANLFWIDRLFRSRHTAPVLRALAWSIEGDKPLSAGMATLIQHSPAGWVHRRLALTFQDLNAGMDLWKSLHDRGLIRSVDAAVLESASQAGNLPWALRVVAAESARRALNRIQSWIAVFSILVLLSLGGTVLVLATAFLAPLFTMITKLAGS